MADTPTRTLAAIEAEIAEERAAYLKSTWAGHDGEADWHETQVDVLLAEWSTVNRGGNT